MTFSRPTCIQISVILLIIFTSTGLIAGSGNPDDYVRESLGSDAVVPDCDNENHIALVPSPPVRSRVLEWWIPRHEDIVNASGRESTDLVFLGNSITQGWKDTGENIWNEYYEERNAINLGYSGDRTENVLWRIQNGEIDNMDPSLVVLLIGTNNTGHREDPPGYTACGVQLILDELRDRLPNTRVLLLAVFPRGESPDDPLRQLNDRINSKLPSMADDQRVFFLDVNALFLDENGHLSEDIMPDFLHPNESGYRLWAEAMEPMIKRLLNAD